MRIAYVAHRVPDRPSKGDKIRAWHVLRALAARHEVHLFAADDAPDRTLERPEWAGEVASRTVVPLRAFAARARMLAAAIRGRALTAGHFAEPRLAAALAQALRERRFDAAVVYSGAVDPLLRGFVPRVLDLVDVDSEKFRLYAEQGAVGPLARVACRLEWRRLRALERRACEEAAATVVCTRAEAATLESFARPRRLEVVGNGVDAGTFPFTPVAERAAGEILFVGALDYAANVDACERLARDLLPRIREQVSEARAVLVGSAPAPRVRALARRPGVELHADVPDVKPFVRRATLALLPFRIARGIQNKALEALASGLPLVASRAVAAGLEGVEGEEWLAGDDDDSLVRQAVALLRDPPARERLAARGRTLALRCYSWPVLLDRFVALVEEAAEAGPPRPAPRARPLGAAP